MSKTDGLDFLSLTDEDEFVGFMVVKLYEKLAYLFSLAIDGRCRSKGYGGRALETLRTLYPANNRWSILKCPTKAHQTRFSAKDDGNSICGTATKESGLFLSYLGVDYEVF